jgi:hypothetical protein
MNNLLPIELSEMTLSVSESKRTEVQNVLQQIFTGTDEWEKQVDAIEVKSVNDKLSIDLAEVARKNAKSARLSAEKLIDAKRNEVQKLKAEFDLEDKLWLKTKQVMQLKFKAIEDKAEWKANFVKRFEAEQKELRTQKRINEVSKYAEINRIEFENMGDESFHTFLSGLKSTYEAKIEAEKIAEAERVAKEKADAEAIEKQKLENLRLKAEAEIQAKILADEKDAKAKIEAELKAKKDAEIKAEVEKKQAEERAKIEAENLAKAPELEQLTIWVGGFSLPEISIQNDKTELIKEKFEAFKEWAKKTINNN